MALAVREPPSDPAESGAAARVRTSTGAVPGGGDARAASQPAGLWIDSLAAAGGERGLVPEGHDARRLLPAYRRRQPHRPEVHGPVPGQGCAGLRLPSRRTGGTRPQHDPGSAAECGRDPRHRCGLHHSARGDRTRDACDRPVDAGPLPGRNRGAFRQPALRPPSRRGPRRLPRRRQLGRGQAAYDQPGERLRGGEDQPGERRSRSDD